MVFNKDIKKLGKAKIINGFVNSNKTATIYYSKQNKVYARNISMGLAIASDSYTEINASEILPVLPDFIIARTGETLSVYEE